MTIDKQTLEKIAHLARLEIKEEDVEKTLSDMNQMLQFVEKLKEVDTEGVEPLVTMSHEINALRDDEIRPHLDREKALASAPQKDKHYFRVPKVLE
jgi:aspartyl-tRNA(Asn)/glutamyl-tRNA(Gln) amidotransferase subunit C